MSDVFNDQLIASLPKLRSHALALTKNKSAADDLVQDSVANALAGKNGFVPGTNFMAWMHRIVHNRFISNMRKNKSHVDIDDVPESSLSVAHGQDARLEIKELAHALDRLPMEQRETLVMVFVNEMSYEQVAEATQCSIGTVKSRVFRARQTLHSWLLDEPKISNKKELVTSDVFKSEEIRAS